MISEKDKRFSELFNAFSQQIFRYIYIRTHDEELANDITQTTFMKTYQKIESIGHEKEKSYIMTIAKNLLIDHYRTRKIYVEYDETSPSCNPLQYKSDSIENILAKEEDSKFINKILDNLEDEDAEIIRLRAVLDWSYTEISEYLKQNEAAIRKRYSRALEKLREIIISLHPQYERN